MSFSPQLSILGVAESLLIAGCFSVSAYFLISAVINLYFSPLSEFPGPRAWAVSRIPYACSLYRGDLAHVVRKLHDRYGPIVRLSPNEVSFIEASAWDDIYGHSLRNPSFPKDPLWHFPAPNGIRSILTANDADHARFRRLLMPGFSEKALRDQEPLIQSYIELFITRLLQKTTETDNGTASVNIVQWFNFILFDIVGDLSFGESFHCLETSQYHPWIAILYSHFKATALAATCRFFPFLERLMRYALPTSVKQKRIDHFNMTKAKVHQRIAAQQNHSWGNVDFMSNVLRHNDEKGMSLPEIESTFNILVLAGSETSSTSLSGTMNYLLKDSVVMGLLVHEIRSSFASPSEITADRVGKLPYLNAVIEEGMRLCQPVPLGLPRKVPSSGATVCGHWLPGDTSVSIPQFAISLSALNFSSPTAFLPSRWLSTSDSYASSLVSFPSEPASFPRPTANQAAFHPFSIGPRRCIGQSLAYAEMRLILARLLWTFDVEQDGEAWAWEEQKTWILWDKRPLNVILRKRA